MQRVRQVDGRSRRRVEAMRRVQAAALELFARRGYGAVTVEEIAGAAGVGPATVYRNFGTKERVVLWDEYDPLLLEAVGRHLGRAPLLEAVVAGLEESLGQVYQEDRARILRRARLLLAHPELVVAASADQALLGAALAGLFRRRAGLGGLQAEVAAGAVVATLVVAARRWVQAGGRVALGALLRRAFRELGALSPPS